MNGHCSKDIVTSIVYTYNHGKYVCINILFVYLFVCVEVLRPSQRLRSCRAGQLLINTVPGQA